MRTRTEQIRTTRARMRIAFKTSRTSGGTWDPYGNPFGNHFDAPYADPFSADEGLKGDVEVGEEWE